MRAASSTSLSRSDWCCWSAPGSGQYPVVVTGSFEDLLAANADYASDFDLTGFDGVARAGVAVVTCMDSRIDPIGMIGLQPGDAKVLRNPGGRVTDQAMIALILGVHLLGVNRVLVIPHTRWRHGRRQGRVLRGRMREACGPGVELPIFGAEPDQLAALRDDVARVREHPLIPDSVAVGGFRYDVDTRPADRGAMTSADGGRRRSPRFRYGRSPLLQLPSASGAVSSIGRATDS